MLVPDYFISFEMMFRLKAGTLDRAQPAVLMRKGPVVVLAAGSMQEAASPPVQIQCAEPNLIRVIADLPLLPGNGARMVNMKHPTHSPPLQL